MGKDKSGTDLWNKPLLEIQARLAVILKRRATVQVHLDAIEQARAAKKSPDELLALVTDLGARLEQENPRQAPTVTLKEQLLPLLLEEQKLLERYGNGHPEVQTVRRRIEAAQALYANAAAAWSHAGGEPGPGPTLESKTDGAGHQENRSAGDAVETHVRYLRQELRLLEGEENSLTESFKNKQQPARDAEVYAYRTEEPRKDIARIEQSIDTKDKQIRDMGTVKAVGGYDARLIASPALGKRVAPLAVLVFPAFALVGLLFGLGLVYLAEVSDKSFRTPEEVRRRLGLPVVGYIPLVKPDPAAVQKAAAGGTVLDPILCVHHHPKSMGSEAYRGVRTALYFSSQGAGHRIIQVTSPNKSDGKSSLVANLAVSIAQSGKKVLVLDADLRKPRIHKIFGLSGQVGLASVIVKDAEPNDAVQETCIPGLSILPCGPLPPNPSELLTSPRFDELLNLLREQYDFVIVDTPPLLAVTDPSVVASRVDGVLLTIRLTKHDRPAAERAREILNTLGASVVGVVINGMDENARGTSYGYGRYGYEYRGYDHEDEAQCPRPACAAGAPSRGREGGMIPLADMHCHLLAGLDDGPRTDEDALAMCRIAYAEGPRIIAAGAHQNEHWQANTPQRIREAADLLARKLQAAGLPLSIFPCAEVMVHPEIEASWGRGELLSVADRGQYLLLEMPHGLFVDLRPWWRACTWQASVHCSPMPNGLRNCCTGRAGSRS